MINFCTLFDSNYLVKGLVMYQSLLKTCPNFHLYILAFDDLLNRTLVDMRLPHVTVISLENFEDDELITVKPCRTAVEYMWTATPSIILYCITKYELEHCTYIDADLCFFSNPSVLIEEMGDNDVLITPHRYSEKYDQTLTSGKYCVQFNTFKNTKNGLNILKEWRADCINWCFNRYEDGKRGDQMYLDSWNVKYEGVYESKHLGGGVAPWNMQQYVFTKHKAKIRGKEIVTNNEFDLVFFHFHYIFSFKKYFFREFNFEIYDLPISVRKIIYIPYLKELIKQFKQEKKRNINIDGLATDIIDKSWTAYIKLIVKRHVKKNQKIFYWINLYG